MLNKIWYYWRWINWVVDPRFHFKSSYDLEIEKPIFLIGNQGDGLTLVSRFFRRNEKVVSVTGNYNYWSGAGEMQNVFGLALPKELTGIRFKAPPNAKFPPPRSWSYGVDELYSVYRKTQKDANQKLEERLKKVIRYSLYRYLPHGIRKGRFIDKSQVFTLRVSLLNELLEKTEPKFILITRNPYATIYRAAVGKAGDMARYKTQKRFSFKERLELSAQHWKNSMTAALKDKEKSDIEMKIVKFENILNNPTHKVKEMCDFIDLDFNINMLPNSDQKIPFGTRFGNKWYPLRPQVNQKYLEEISADVVGLIESRCGDMALKLDYYPPDV